MEQKILSVSELNEHIRLLLDGDDLLAGLCVRGELSNYKIYPSGHHYFTLKDDKCALRCVMFRSSAEKLRFRPENGLRVLVTGRVSVYPRDGAYQLYCSSLTPEGVGDLHLAFEQLKAKLEAEGLFDRARKKPLPAFPKRIAVITSGAGAAVRDIIRVLRARWPMSKVIILPVRVQGAEAPPEIVGALRYANRWQVADLIITGRGGGSIEDLWAFNDERVARAIAQSEIPVISAVGHEPDVTIADYVADLRAATPSNGAELAVPDQMEMRAHLQQLRTRCREALNKQLRVRREKLGLYAERRALRDPLRLIEYKRQLLDSVSLRMVSAQRESLAHRRRAQAEYAAKLDALSPLKVLARGYSIARNTDGLPLRSAAQVSPGEKIDLTLSDGALRCAVEEVYHGHNEETAGL
ncbi:MAG: exodeoxyribonuclease VII large subunit [Ruminococcaceae bacterium]|nr:exodeoxyribonuclease VII large subunit [Oscillospiraceae bacterium]